MGAYRAGEAIILDQGWRGLFQGHSATLLRIFPYAAIKFMAYEQLKNVMMPTKESETHLRKFLAGSLAGCTAVFCSYPLDLLRVRLALETKAQSSQGLWTTCKLIYTEGSPPNRMIAPLAGLLNFYKGFAPTIYGMIPYAGVSFLTYESLKNYASSHFTEYTLVQNHNNDTKPRLKAWAYLSCGAVSGALAQTASYPLEVIRRMMQISGSHTGPSLPGFDGRSILTVAQYIWKRKGFRGFWVGLSIGYIKVTPMFAISFYVYEFKKTTLGIDE